MNRRLSRLLLIGDPRGLPQLLEAVPRQHVIGLVGAAIRPAQHEALQAIARAWGLPLLIQPPPSDPAFEAFRAAVEALAPELILVNSYAMWLPPSILELARHGGINLHGALLPAYRGASPLQNALLNGERETGVTMHVLAPGFDEGPIIAERRVPIHFDDTWAVVHERIIAATSALLASELPKVLSLCHDARPQDPGRARYYRRRHPEDGAIDWNRDVLYLYNLVRALVHPHPGAFYYAGGQRILLDRYLPLPRVAALKYDANGGNRVLKGPALSLMPLQPAAGQPSEALDRNDQIMLDIEGPARARLGHGRLMALDFETRTARLSAEIGATPASDRWDEALRLMLAFAFLELNLARVESSEAEAGCLDGLIAAGFDTVGPRHVHPRNLAITRSSFLRGMRASPALIHCRKSL